MIPVKPAVEPQRFNAAVRQPGLRAIAELVGEMPPRTAGQRHAQVAESRNEISAGAFPTHWREVLDDLLASYDRTCSYLCLYIPRGTGAPSVDHMVAKSMRWDQVYEWTNYRLACALMNARKGAVARVLDPFEIEGGWFALELVAFQVVPGDGLPDDTETLVQDTIDQLQLNDDVCCDARGEYVHEYQGGHISLDYVMRHAPFVAQELRRLGELRVGDV